MSRRIMSITALGALLLGGCAANASDDGTGQTEADVTSSSSLLEYVSKLQPFAATDPASNRGALEKRFERLDAVSNAVAHTELPGESRYDARDGTLHLAHLEKRAARMKSEGFAVTGPNVFRERFDDFDYYIVDYEESKGSSASHVRLVVNVGGELFLVGTMAGGAPSGTFQWLSSSMNSGRAARVSICSHDPDSWTARVYIDESVLRDKLGGYDGFERVEIIVNDAFTKRNTLYEATFDPKGSTPGRLDLFTVTFGSLWSEATYGNTRMPTRVLIHTNKRVVEIDADALPPRAHYQGPPSCGVTLAPLAP